MFWSRKRSITERKKTHEDIAPDEIFLDSSNLPNFDTYQFEGRLERPVSVWSILLTGIFFLLIVVIALWRLWNIQVVEGDTYFDVSERNRLDHEIIFAHRGVIVDRRGTQLAWNESVLDSDEISTSSSATTIAPSQPALRKYYNDLGLSHILGYVSYPKKDEQGFYFQEEIIGKDGVELFYDELLAGENGRRLTEINALGEQQSKTLVYKPTDGAHLDLTIDAELQAELYKNMDALADDIGFTGGGAVLLDVTNGEILAMTSVPEYESASMTDGSDVEKIEGYFNSSREPFLNRVIGGLYTPGSSIKPFIAAGALDRNIIDPKTQIYSAGALELPNPYDPENPSIFKDWKAHGWVDMRRALAVSSNVYFFEIGGGFEKQKGLGIAGIDEYVERFGIGQITGIDLAGEVVGVIPSPSWKSEFFPNDPWRIGDTYNTSIGQYGFQVTPLQMVRAVAAIANGGFLVKPHIRLDERVAPRERVRISDEDLQIVREGMRQGVLEGTAKGLNMTSVEIAAKTGTAELGTTKERVNSWVIGFFPYENPRYAFAGVMERGPATNVIGSLFVMRRLFDWMSIHRPEYLKVQ